MSGGRKRGGALSLLGLKGREAFLVAPKLALSELEGRCPSKPPRQVLGALGTQSSGAGRNAHEAPSNHLSGAKAGFGAILSVAHGARLRFGGAAPLQCHHAGQGASGTAEAP